MQLARPLAPQTARRVAACALSILALAAPARPQGGPQNFEGLYLGSGQLVQPCQFPSGPATFMDTIVSAKFTVTQYVGLSRIAGPFHARRPNGSEYDNSLDVLVTIAGDGTFSGVADYLYD
jgi:hypothetical protein